MLKWFRWKFVLPTLQLLLAVCLWLYIPVQLRKDLLRAVHEPTEHPFRYRLPPLAPEEKLAFSPPLCGRVLYVMNFPVDTIARQVIYPVEAHIELWMGAGLPQWSFGLPVNDPEALEPREVRYWIHISDILFFAGVVLLWYWVGSRIDECFERKQGVNRPRRRVFHILESAIILTVALLSGFRSYQLMVNEYSLHYRHVGMLGLMWPTALLFYCWFAFQRAQD